jgi:hypothetical protein
VRLEFGVDGSEFQVNLGLPLAGVAHEDPDRR